MCRISPRTLRLREDRIITLRSAELSDAGQCIAFLDGMLQESEFLAISPGELKPTVAEEEAWIRGHLESPASIVVVAEHQGIIIGVLDFRRGNTRKTQHGGSFGVSVRSAFHGMGIGAALVQTLLDWARESPHIEIVSLGVYANNPRAIALYERLGFQHTGKNPRCFKLPSGEYVDDLIMYQLVK